MPPRDSNLALLWSEVDRYSSPVQTAIAAPAIPYRNAPRNRPPPRQMRPAEQRAMDPNAGVRRQAMGQLERRSAVDLATMPRTPRGNQFAEAGGMALEFTGLPQVRRGAETLGDVAQAPYQPNAPMRALSGAGELGLGVLGAATFGEMGAMRPRTAPPRRPTPAAPPAAADPEALSLARSWIDSFGGGPAAEARAIEVMREQLQEGGHPIWRQRLQDAIDSVSSRTYVQGEGNYFSPRVQEALPEIYGGSAAPDPSPPLTRPPQGASVQSEIRSDGAIELARLSTPFGQRGQGQARQAMNDLIRNADGEGRDIWLRAEPLDKSTDAERLRGFYRGLGFEDAGADGRMVRRAADPPPPLTRPPTQIAPNGMPIRPPQPFRNSLRGGNDDLAEAASMRAPDVGNAGGGMVGGTPDAMARARDAGFDETPFFHGTGRSVEGGFKRSGSGALGPGVYMARNPKTTEVFAGTPRGGLDADGRLNVEFGTGANIMPLMVRGKKWATENQLDAAISRIMEQRGRYASRSDAAADAVEELRRQGFTGVADPERDFYNVFEPSSIRSRFAAFNPARNGEADLLAGIGGLGLTGMFAAKENRT